MLELVVIVGIDQPLGVVGEIRVQGSRIISELEFRPHDPISIAIESPNTHLL